MVFLPRGSDADPVFILKGRDPVFPRGSDADPVFILKGRVRFFPEGQMRIRFLFSRVGNQFFFARGSDADPFFLFSKVGWARLGSGKLQASVSIH